MKRKENRKGEEERKEERERRNGKGETKEEKGYEEVA